MLCVDPCVSTLHASQTCQGADAAIVVIGSSMIENDKSADGSLRPAHEGEGLDRNNLDLPGRQADLIRALARRAPGLPVVAVLFNGGGLDVGWIDRMPAVSAMMAVGFPGQVRGDKWPLPQHELSAVMLCACPAGVVACSCARGVDSCTRLCLCSLSASCLARATCIQSIKHVSDTLLLRCMLVADPQEGGRGIADVLFGRINPSGRLPITWYHNNYTSRVSQLDLRMRPDSDSGYPGRSYRWAAQ
jgi:hypothetical protein